MIPYDTLEASLLYSTLYKLVDNENRNVRELIESRVKIVEVIKEYTKLTKYSGNYFQGICPFRCKKPYFRVNSKLNHYYCRGCNPTREHIRLDVFCFLRSVRPLKTYLEIWKYLIQKCNINLSKESAYHLGQYEIEINTYYKKYGS